MSQSKLQETYNACSDKMQLPSLDEIKIAIALFYQDRDIKSKRPGFISLGNIIDFRFVKKMLYASDFK